MQHGPHARFCILTMRFGVKFLCPQPGKPGSGHFWRSAGTNIPNPSPQMGMSTMENDTCTAWRMLVGSICFNFKNTISVSGIHHYQVKVEENI